MCDGLCVGRDAVVFLCGQVDVLGAEAAEDGLDFGKGLVRGAVLDEDEGLVVRVDVGAVERVAGYDVDIFGEEFLERFDLGVFTRCLAAYNGTEAGCWTGVARSELSGRGLREGGYGSRNMNRHTQGPYWATTRLMAAASTL